MKLFLLIGKKGKETNGSWYRVTLPAKRLDNKIKVEKAKSKSEKFISENPSRCAHPSVLRWKASSEFFLFKKCAKCFFPGRIGRIKGALARIRRSRRSWKEKQLIIAIYFRFVSRGLFITLFFTAYISIVYFLSKGSG